MSKKDEALKRAEDALKRVRTQDMELVQLSMIALAAIREAWAEQPAPMIRGDIRDGLVDDEPAQQEPMVAIRALTDQCFALIQERDELQKQVWRYEKNGVTCQTYRHKVDASCAECNVHEVYTSPPAQRTWVGLTNEGINALLGQFPHYSSEWDEFDFYVLARAIEAELKEKNT